MPFARKPSRRIAAPFYRRKGLAVLMTVSAVVFTAAVLQVLPARAAGYNLSILAQTGDVIGGAAITDFNTSVAAFGPALGNDGIVSFYANSTNSSGNGRALFTSGPGASGLVAVSGGSVGGTSLGSLVGFVPGRGADGSAVFGALNVGPSGAQGVFSQNGLLATVGQTFGNYQITSLNARFYGVNDNGQAVFAAAQFIDKSNNNATGSGGLFTQNGLIVRLDQPLSGGYNTFNASDLANLRLNNNGTVAFLSSYDSANPTNRAIFTQNGVLARSLDSFPGVTGGVSRVQTIHDGRFGFNDSSQYAYRALISDTNLGAYEAIVTSAGIAAQPGTIIGGNRISTLTPTTESGVALNNSGEIAFQANSSGGIGIFTSTTVVALQNMQVGNKTISQFYAQSTPSLNNSGFIAFLAGFTDGTQGIVLATPGAGITAAPEPGTLALLGIGIVVSAAPLLRRRH